MAWIHLLGNGRHVSFVRCHLVWLRRFWQCQGMRVLHVESDECKRLERVNNGHQLRENPFVAYGYLSIGCFPCTRPVRSGEDARAGRWSGRQKTECGIHLSGLDRSLTDASL